MISNVPKDHHSLLQLYLDGPKDKIFNIFSLERNSKEKINIKNFINTNNFFKQKKLRFYKRCSKESFN